MLTDMAGMAEFGALIKRARERQGMTGVELAQRIGRPHPFVVRIETARNANPPDPQTLRDLAAALDVTPRTMLEALGYLDAEVLSDDDVLSVSVRDPRADVLALLEGLTDEEVRNVTSALRTLLRIAPHVRDTQDSPMHHTNTRTA